MFFFIKIQPKKSQTNWRRFTIIKTALRENTHLHITVSQEYLPITGSTCFFGESVSVRKGRWDMKNVCPPPGKHASSEVATINRPWGGKVNIFSIQTNFHGLTFARERKFMKFFISFCKKGWSAILLVLSENPILWVSFSFDKATIIWIWYRQKQSWFVKLLPSVLFIPVFRPMLLPNQLCVFFSIDNVCLFPFFGGGMYFLCVRKFPCSFSLVATGYHILQSTNSFACNLKERGFLLDWVNLLSFYLEKWVNRLITVVNSISIWTTLRSLEDLMKKGKSVFIFRFPYSVKIIKIL